MRFFMNWQALDLLITNCRFLPRFHRDIYKFWFIFRVPYPGKNSLSAYHTMKSAHFLGYGTWRIVLSAYHTPESEHLQQNCDETGTFLLIFYYICFAVNFRVPYPRKWSLSTYVPWEVVTVHLSPPGKWKNNLFRHL